MPIATEELFLVNVLPKGQQNIKFRVGDASYGINGKYKHMDTPARMQANHMIVPRKYITEALGMSSDQVIWDKEKESLTIYADKLIELKVGSNLMKVDGKTVQMSTHMSIINGRTMVPLGNLLTALGISYTWDNNLQTTFFTI